MTHTANQRAIIYCRVSDKKQIHDGDGLQSQEHRCRDYAAARGYDVEAVFHDEVSGGGDFMQRPGMVAMLQYMKAPYGKSIRRAAIEGEFEALLHDLRPAPELFSVARTMFEDLWNDRLASAKASRTSLKAEHAKVARDIERFLDRIAQAEPLSVIAVYESRIRRLEERKIEISEKLANCGRPLRSFDEALRTREPLQSLGFRTPGAQEGRTETRVRRPADLRSKRGI